MALSADAKRRIVIAVASKTAGPEISTAIDASTSGVAANAVSIATNASDISDNASDIADLQARFTSGQTDGSGIISIAGLAGTETVLVTPQEDLGTNIVLSHVVVEAGQITIYGKNTDTLGAAAVIATKNFAIAISNAIV